MDLKKCYRFFSKMLAFVGPFMLLGCMAYMTLIVPISVYNQGLSVLFIPIELPLWTVLGIAMLGSAHEVWRMLGEFGDKRIKILNLQCGIIALMLIEFVLILVVMHFLKW